MPVCVGAPTTHYALWVGNMPIRRSNDLLLIAELDHCRQLMRLVGRQPTPDRALVGQHLAKWEIQRTAHQLVDRDKLYIGWGRADRHTMCTMRPHVAQYSRFVRMIRVGEQAKDQRAGLGHRLRAVAIFEEM